jgi:hypothetical protein
MMGAGGLVILDPFAESAKLWKSARAYAIKQVPCFSNGIRVSGAVASQVVN